MKISQHDPTLQMTDKARAQFYLGTKTNYTMYRGDSQQHMNHLKLFKTPSKIYVRLLTVMGCLYPIMKQLNLICNLQKQIGPQSSSFDEVIPTHRTMKTFSIQIFKRSYLDRGLLVVIIMRNSNKVQKLILRARPFHGQRP